MVRGTTGCCGKSQGMLVTIQPSHYPVRSCSSELRALLLSSSFFPHPLLVPFVSSSTLLLFSPILFSRPFFLFFPFFHVFRSSYLFVLFSLSLPCRTLASDRLNSHQATFSGRIRKWQLGRAEFSLCFCLHNSSCSYR